MYIIYCDICGYIKGNFKNTELNCPVCNNELKYTEQVDTDKIKQLIKMTRKEKNQYIESLSGHPIDSSYKDKLLDYEIEHHNHNQERLGGNKVTCPYCKSTNTSKITIANKAAHTAVFGIWSMGRNAKQWHCNKCKSDF